MFSPKPLENFFPRRWMLRRFRCVQIFLKTISTYIRDTTEPCEGLRQRHVSSSDHNLKCNNSSALFRNPCLQSYCIYIMNRVILFVILCSWVTAGSRMLNICTHKKHNHSWVCAGTFSACPLHNNSGCGKRGAY